MRNVSLSKSSYDVIVVGGGHAGCEAALASARLGFSTLLVTGSLDRIAAMSCNPAIGGVGKGHLVKEIDALGGEMARVADETGIHFRTLNSSRGPAVQATRCQSDMERYRQSMTRVVLSTPHLLVRQDDVVDILRDEEGAVCGVRGRHSGSLLGRRVILTTGTFMDGQLHLGAHQTPGGRAGEAPARGLSDALRKMGLRMARLRTGTCPRLDGRSIRVEILQEQAPQWPAPRFSFERSVPSLPQVSCFMTHTNKKTHEIIRQAVESGDAPIYNGQIEGLGPRHCPSIEAKVIRFSEKESHLIFLEPQGLDTFEVYPNGLFTSLSPAVQLQFLRSIEGLQEVEVTRWGYAVEYDFIDPTELFLSLETKKIKNLFCAGQINGTTGYEEAAIQGLVAGINAARSLQSKPPLVLPRHLAYAGVLLDDLTTQGTQEPYRMFTSRAEHRLVLREDNVYARLMETGFAVGLLEQARYLRMKKFEEEVKSEIARLEKTRIKPDPKLNALLASLGTKPITEPVSLAFLLKRPEIMPAAILAFDPVGEAGNHVDPQVAFRAAIEIKYEGYIQRAHKAIEREKGLEEVSIPAALFERQLPGLSHEIFEKMCTIKPQTLGQASRISGMTPAALSLMIVEIRKLGGLI